jgi:co-chaperonin GroES (HSP10)
MAKAKPIFQRILLEKIKKEKTTGGIILPDESKDTMFGRIISKGELVDHPDIQEGALVYVGKYTGTNVKPNPDNDKEEYFLCHEEDVLCVIEENDDE